MKEKIEIGLDDKTLRRVQMVQFEILKEFKRICDVYNLNYILEWMYDSSKFKFT